MTALSAAAKAALAGGAPLPFSLYTSHTEQRILNAPILKPLLICVLAGVKHLGRDAELVCPAGSFVFLPNSPTIDMRNIPVNEEYCAMLIDFDHADFHQFQRSAVPARPHLLGPVDAVLAKTLQQFAEWSVYAPPGAWHFRKKELLQLLYQAGHHGVAAMAAPPSFSHQLHDMISADIAGDWSVKRVTAALAVSESTLLRNLKAEGTDLLAIVNRTRLGHALHLIQTTRDPIGRIADRCGYYSQSRFTEKFKLLFGVTPTGLRKTRL
ncbi:helix-turn-helix domain-containing protein [Duganella ginsengisoli]|uniref:Helix-turn-helix domain-containing protein n=1 Tax=Pseudoduganella ginsengisoli TaxID=1462440 RepID=A0A6L6Q6T8_9BURK|nr:helix-turn-helix domain-containing protein [Pseudoduganella ginsengisoli]